MIQSLTTVVSVARHSTRDGSPLLVSVNFVDGSKVSLATVLEVVEGGILVEDNGSTKLLVLQNATQVEFHNND